MGFFQTQQPRLRNTRVVTLNQWLDWAAGRRKEVRVQLPMIQRGSVWKPSQIIELWDTVLRGLPIGALMVSEITGDSGRTIPLDAGSEIPMDESSMRLALVDGQQRTLALLTGWPSAEADRTDKGTAKLASNARHRLWIDFADEPRGQELVRMRVTTANQPFGFSRDDPDKKLSLSERRKAWESSGVEPDEWPDFADTKPYTHGATFLVELKVLVECWDALEKAGSTDVEAAWISRVMGKADNCASSDLATDLKNGNDTAACKQVHKQVALLSQHLAKLSTAEVALLRVDETLFERPQQGAPKQTEPLLALLFKRVGTNGAKLSDDDYIYAILKHLVPDVHDMVEKLHKPAKNHANGTHQTPGTIANLLSATDVVMSALRLAAASFRNWTHPVSDPDRPSKEQFHTLIDQPDFLHHFCKVLSSNGNDMGIWFTQVLSCIDYRGGMDPGLPRHALPHLGRPLVQVLLRLAQVGYLGTADSALSPVRRDDVLRLVMYWWVFVTDAHKASRNAFTVIGAACGESSDHDAVCTDLGLKIAMALHRDGASHVLVRWEAMDAQLRAAPPTMTQGDRARIRGEARFNALPDSADQARAQRILTTWRNCWCQPWSHKHPILLWLQRSYVSKLPGDPSAGRDEDTAYDYDHILPWSRWGEPYNTGKADVFKAHCEQASVIGHHIGNLRVWLSTDNRSDGDALPADKLRNDQVAIDSAIGEPLHWKVFANKGNHFKWNCELAIAFETAVEQRALDLYKRFLTESNLEDRNWLADWSMAPPTFNRATDVNAELETEQGQIGPQRPPAGR